MRRHWRRTAVALAGSILLAVLTSGATAYAKGGHVKAANNIPSSYLTHQNFGSLGTVTAGGTLSGCDAGAGPTCGPSQTNGSVTHGTLSSEAPACGTGGACRTGACSATWQPLQGALRASLPSATGQISFDWLDSTFESEYPSWIQNPEPLPGSDNAWIRGLGLLNEEMHDVKTAPGTGYTYTYVAYEYTGGTWNVSDIPGETWNSSMGNVCYGPTTTVPKFTLGTSYSFTIWSPPITTGTPVPPSLEAKVSSTFHTGSIGFSPAGSNYVFVPTCNWLVGAALPFTQQTYTAWSLVQVPDGLGGTDILFLEYKLTVQVNSVTWNFGDDTTLSSAQVGYTGAAMAGHAGSSNYNGSSWSSCSYQHEFKKVGTFPVSATVVIGVSALVTWNDGTNTHTINLSVARPTLTLTSPASSRSVYQVEGV